jgi:hypothetical protein
MTTTSMKNILAHSITLIEAVTPTAPPKNDRPFRHNSGASRPLRQWIPDAGGNDMFRRFDIEVDGDRLDIGMNNLEQGSLVEVPFLVLLSYPARPHLFGYAERYELADLIESDARLVRDTLFLGGNESDAHHANLDPLIRRLERDREDVWFQEISFVAVFDAAQS